jgi:hypothetical protein
MAPIHFFGGLGFSHPRLVPHGLLRGWLNRGGGLHPDADADAHRDFFIIGVVMILMGVLRR